MSDEDYKLFKKMEQHSFVTLSLMDLPHYQEEEELILKES